ncbi:MAG: ATP-binding cassette domain-containing protein [Candidatus Latescibacterota bacterium]
MIQLSAVSFGYGRSDLLFDGLDLHLNPGVHGLLGLNGAGKTSLLKLISGLRRAWQGTCTTLGHDASRREVEMLQDAFIVLDEVPVSPHSALDLAKERAGFYPRFDHALYGALLEECEVAPDKSLKALSTGQRKKSMIAFGVATGCRLLLLDEPTNGLDIPSKSTFRRIIARHLDEDRCVIISTHQILEVENLLDSVMVLKDGKIVFQADLDAVHSAVGLTEQPAQEADLIYSEDRPLGQRYLVAASGAPLAQVDLETLFNAAMAEPQRLTNALSAGAQL